MKNRSICLLSGGLDSTVSLAASLEEYSIELAITFDYGQKSIDYEIKASKNISNYYNIEHKIIKLDWLKDITHTALVSKSAIPDGKDMGFNSMKNVWVPNRNALFLNIAAAYAEGEKYSHIIIGANREESNTFPDNTIEFINRMNSLLEYSTLSHPTIIAPLINFDKNDIVKLALDRKVPLQFIHSCYDGAEKHCGICESCTRLKNALIANSDKYYIGELF